MPVACIAENNKKEVAPTESASVSFLSSCELQQDSQPEVSITISAIPTDLQENCNMDNTKEADKNEEPLEVIPKSEEVGSCEKQFLITITLTNFYLKCLYLIQFIFTIFSEAFCLGKNM